MKSYRLIIFTPLFLIAACSNEQESPAAKQSSQVQLFKEQTEALEKAKEVENMLQTAVDRNKKIIEDQSK